MSVEVARVGASTFGWGESVVWDERRERLVFADCLGSKVHWLDDVAAAPDDLRTFATPSMPTGIVPAEDGRLVVVLDDGLHVVDLDAGTTALLTDVPEAMGGRGNDLCAEAVTIAERRLRELGAEPMAPAAAPVAPAGAPRQLELGVGA